MTTIETSAASVAALPVRRAFRLDRENDLAVLWFDYPGEKANKFSAWVVEELDRHLDDIAAMGDLRFLVIASAKETIFIAGADVDEFTKVESKDQAVDFIRFGQRVMLKLANLPQVTVAAINGACMGGGTELALNCDYRVMSDGPKSSIGLPETMLGILPAWSGTTRLPQLVGLPAALDLILTGRTLKPKKAKAIGLVDEVVPHAILVEAAKKFVRKADRKRKKKGRTHLWLESNPPVRNFVFRKAKQGVMKKSGGHYPAPLAVLDVMKTGLSKGFDEGLEAEVDAASNLIIGPIAQNLVRLYFMREQAKKERGPAPRPVERAGVLGAGLMGGGIAQAISDKAEIPVRLRDINWPALSSGMKAASKIWKKKLDQKRMTRNEFSTKLARIAPTIDWSGFSNVDLVIEAVVENLAIKQQVLSEFEKLAKPGAIFATNTSTIPITQIAAKAAHPENVVGMHFFSPVEKMPLLEVIAGEKTSPQTLSTAAAFGKKLGKTVVICKDGPGFIVNRVLAPYINEAGQLLAEGNTIESIDLAMTRFGMPLGPLALLDEVGIDIASKSSHVLVESFAGRMQLSQVLEALLTDNRMGKKNGRGVYLWKNGKRAGGDPEVYKLAGLASKHDGDLDAMAERMVLAMVNEAALILEEKIAGSTAELDLAMIFGTGFPPFRGGPLRYADSLGIPYVVARMNDLETKVGPRFVASAPLRQMAERGQTFYERYPKAT